MFARSPRIVSALVLGVSLTWAAHAMAQDVAQPEVENARHQFAGRINANSVYVRSGPGQNYYPTVKLDSGADVTVVGIRFEWLKITPPKESFCYVAKAYVDRQEDGATGVVTRPNLNVRAGSSLNAMKTTVQTRLEQGAQVRIIGERDEYFMIEPPPGAYLYVHQQFVEPVRVLADAANARESAGSRDDAADEQADASPADDPAEALRPVEAEELPIASDPVAPAAPEAVAVETQFDALEAEFNLQSEKPIDQQPIDQWLAQYQTFAANDQLPESMRRIAEHRVQILTVRSEALTHLLENQRLQQEAEQRRLALQTEREELAEIIRQNEVKVYTVIGTMQTSSLQPGGETLYRLTDPGTGRTLVYMQTSDQAYLTHLGRLIGVRGQITTDTRFNIQVISPTEAEPVEASQIATRVAAQIVPPSLMPREAQVSTPVE